MLDKRLLVCYNKGTKREGNTSKEKETYTMNTYWTIYFMNNTTSTTACPAWFVWLMVALFASLVGLFVYVIKDTWVD